MLIYLDAGAAKMLIKTKKICFAPPACLAINAPKHKTFGCGANDLLTIAIPAHVCFGCHVQTTTHKAFRHFGVYTAR